MDFLNSSINLRKIPVVSSVCYPLLIFKVQNIVRPISSEHLLHALRLVRRIHEGETALENAVWNGSGRIKIKRRSDTREIRKCSFDCLYTDSKETSNYSS